MINQQVVDFIKSQLLKGVDREIIKKELLGNGWNEVDVQECFNNVDTPVVVPAVSPVADSSIYNNTNNNNLIQNTNSSGKKVLFSVIVLFLIGGGSLGYYFRNDIPIVKDLMKTKEIVIINEIKQEDSAQAQIINEEVSVSQQELNNNTEVSEKLQSSNDQNLKDVVLSEKDCGISKNTPELEAGWEFSYKGDPALKCFGESVLNCKKAKVVIYGGNLLDKNPALLQVVNNNGTCLLKYTGYQKQYTQCPVSTFKELDMSKSSLEGSNPNLVFKNIDTTNPERYTASLYVSMVTIPIIGDIQYQKNGCTGDLYKTMSELLSKAREKYIKK